MAMNLHFLHLVRGVVDTTAVAYYLSLAAQGLPDRPLPRHSKVAVVAGRAMSRRFKPYGPR